MIRLGYENTPAAADPPDGRSPGAQHTAGVRSPVQAPGPGQRGPPARQRHGRGRL